MANKDVTFTKCKINNNTKLNAMIDSGSTSTFLNKSIAKKLKLFIIPKQKSISLADPNQKAKIIGEVVVDIELNGYIHSGLVVVRAELSPF